MNQDTVNPSRTDHPTKAQGPRRSHTDKTERPKMSRLLFQALLILSIVIAPLAVRAQPHAEIISEGAVHADQPFSLRYSGLEASTPYWAVLFDPATQTGSNGDYVEYANVHPGFTFDVTFRGVSAGAYVVRLQPAVRGAKAILETRINVRAAAGLGDTTVPETTGRDPFFFVPETAGRDPFSSVPVIAGRDPFSSVPNPATALLARSAYHTIGVPEDVFLESYEAEISCSEMAGFRLRIHLTDIQPGVTSPRITGRFTLANAAGVVRVQGPMTARSASVVSRRLVFVLDYEAFRDAGMRDFWVNGWQVYVSADLNEIESRHQGCRALTFVPVPGSLAPRNDASTQAGSELAAAQMLNLHTVGESCRTARTRNQIGACIFQSIIYNAGPGSIRNYTGLALHSLVPSGTLVPSTSECRNMIDSIRRDMSALGMAFIRNRNERLTFTNTALNCRSVGYLRNQLFSETLSLSNCQPNMRTLADFRGCLDQFAEVYAPAHLAAMRQAAEQTFQDAIGMVPEVINDGFTGDAMSEIVEALENDAEWCRRGALNPNMLNIGNDPYGHATGAILAGTAFGQLSADDTERQPLDWSTLQSRVTCEHVMQLLGHYTNAGDALLAEYQALSESAREAMCVSSRSEDGPSERLLAVAVNSFLVSHCTNADFLSFWLDDAANGRDPQGNPLALAILDFTGSSNRCRVQSRLTTSFSQPELSFRVTRATIVDQVPAGNGRFSMGVNAWLSCQSNSTSRTRQAIDCSLFEIAPAPFSLIASWSESTCEWSVSDVQRMR
ncbi:hypothetical protein [Pararhodobacter oceanensis]|uniref:Uncharacterized protein n=1 Tax=Pararhodobacter oceanensis TaxID=2172121 RepID=A0A2T8HX61_9RHOB|nr:hypothetical protein [Pararhodobacter oceanensis]PVH30013.1 hypothetical protein DDE20_00025 [Pararhodobacter oceanensis]